MAVKQTGRKTYKTMQGKAVDNLLRSTLSSFKDSSRTDPSRRICEYHSELGGAGSALRRAHAEPPSQP